MKKKKKTKKQKKFEEELKKELELMRRLTRTPFSYHAYKSGKVTKKSVVSSKKSDKRRKDWFFKVVQKRV